MDNTTEKLNGDAVGSVAVRKPVVLGEQAEAEGVYSVVATGPVEQFRERYGRLKERMRRKGFFGFIDRLVYGRRIMAELLAIPMEQKWAEEFPNVVTTVGKNFALNTFLDATGYTKTGPYIGLINSTASAATVGDTMALHTGWLEVGSTNLPGYTGGRKLAVWSAAVNGEKQLSASVVFDILNSGTVGGCFLVLGTGASATVLDSGGVLYSAGAFTGGSKVLNLNDSLAVSYKASL